MRRGELDPSSVSSAQSSTIIGRNLELPFDGDATNVARLAEQSNHKRRSSTTQDDTRMAAIGTTSDEESELNETTYGQNKSRPFYDPLQLSMAHKGERQKFYEKEKEKERFLDACALQRRQREAAARPLTDEQRTQVRQRANQCASAWDNKPKEDK